MTIYSSYSPTVSATTWGEGTSGVGTTTIDHIGQWRAYIGPPWERSDDTSFYDWSSVELGLTWTATPVDTALSGALAAGSVTALIAGTTGWPTKGGLWIGPGTAVDESWEYVTYTGLAGGTLSGLKREDVTAEQTGAHGSAATCRFWWPITTDDGKLSLTESADGLLTGFGWSGRMAGANFPQPALRNGHLAVIQARWLVTGATQYSDWQVVMVGWLQNPAARDDVEGRREWSVDLVGVNGILDKLKAGGIHSGPVDMGLGANVTAISTLATWYKEQHSGEFSGSNPDLNPSQVIDNDPATLWIAERHIGARNHPDQASSAHQKSIDNIHINPYVGQSKGYRWIQIGELGSGRTRLCNNLMYTPKLWDDRVDKPQSSRFWILCESRTRFLAENPDYGGATVAELSSNTCDVWEVDLDTGEDLVVGYTVEDWWDSLDPKGHALWLLERGALGNSWALYGGVVWGSATATADLASDLWPAGGALGTVLPGQTIRRIWANSHEGTTGWNLSYVSTPGFYLSSQDPAWLTLELASMDLRLTNGITIGTPTAGGTLLVSNAAGPSTDGLSASGTVQVGFEQITYTAKTTSGIVVDSRAANSTIEAAHSAGDTLYFVEGGIATDAVPLTEVQIVRTSGLPVLTEFSLYGSTYSVARNPSDTGWLSDYTSIGSQTANTASVYTQAISPAKRYKWLTMLIESMSTDPYRPMLNTLKVTGDATAYGTANVVSGGQIGSVVAAITNSVGIPTTAVTVTATGTYSGFTTAPEFAWPVLCDLCEMTGNRIIVGRDSKISVDSNSFWNGTATPTEDYDFTRLTASAWAPDWRSGRNVGQLELVWQDLSGANQDSIFYPETADQFGDKVRVGPIMYADSAAATQGATRRYWQQRRPLGGVLEAVGAPWDIRSRYYTGITWPMGGTEVNAMDRTYLIDQSNHEIAEGKLTSVFHVLQVSGGSVEV